VSLKQNILMAIVILSLFSLLLFIGFGENGLADLNLLQTERDSLLKKNEELVQKNLSLYREIERLKNDPKYVEDVARQELGVIGKDEIIFKIKKKRKGEID
jgi:cell division protein FtsB